MAPAGFFKRFQTSSAKHSHDDAEHIGRRRALILYCKKATKFTFSNLGLCLVVGLYAIAGTYMFMAVEQTNEKQLCVEVCFLVMVHKMRKL
jgi:ribosomal protein L36